MWNAIELGMGKRSPIWEQIKMNLILQDEAVKKGIDWGELYSTDQFAYDSISFKTVIEAVEEDKVISI